MASSCCCYIVDPGYLFPTLVSASQAKHALARDDVDVLIFCVTDDAAAISQAHSICRQYDVKLIAVDPKTIDDMHVMFGRFFLDRLLDPGYESVVYIDGDTQVAGSLAPLLDIALPEGKFLAAPDPISVMIDTSTALARRRRAYFGSIGIPPCAMHRYCNSGVLRFNRRDWAVISRAALQSSARHGHRLRFPDQDALNLAFGSDCLMMSYRWNFPAFLLNFGFESIIQPRVYHFMSNPRPWNGSFRPWGRTWHSPYLRIADAHPELAAAHAPMGWLRFLKYAIQQRVKPLLEAPVWTSRLVRERILSHEAQALV